MRETLAEAGPAGHVLEWNRETGEWPEAVTRQPGTLPPARGRLRGAVPARVHVGHDGAPEGGAPRAGRLPRLDRARGRLPDRRQGGRPRALRHRHGLDHGPVDRRRRRRRRRDDRVRRGRARLAGRPALAARRVGARDDARPLAHARARAHPQGRADGGHVLAAGDLHDRRAVEPRPLPVAPRARRRLAHADRERLRRHRGRRVLPDDGAHGADQAGRARLSRARASTSTSSTPREGRCAARSASSSAGGRGRG